MVKLTVAFLMTYALMIPGAAQQQGNQDMRVKVKNHEPVINSLTASFATVTMPCPSWRKPNLPCGPSGDYMVSLSTEASDPDGDKLSYKYFVAGG